ncbi:hypothetical protein VPHD290_0022 [Vibrio phage D290]
MGTNLVPFSFRLKLNFLKHSAGFCDGWHDKEQNKQDRKYKVGIFLAKKPRQCRRN